MKEGKMKKIINIQDSRKENLIKKYCRHLKSGYSSESFPDEDSKLIEYFAKELDNKKCNEQCTNLINKAKRERLLLWEQIGIKGIIGEKNKFNGSAWMFVMKNLLGINNFKHKNKDEIIKVNLDFENGKKGDDD